MQDRCKVRAGRRGQGLGLWLAVRVSGEGGGAVPSLEPYGMEVKCGFNACQMCAKSQSILVESLLNRC